MPLLLCVGRLRHSPLDPLSFTLEDRGWLANLLATAGRNIED